MKEKKVSPSIIKNIVVISVWVMLLLLNLLIITMQMLGKVYSSNIVRYICALVLVFVIYAIGIGLNIRNLIVEVKQGTSLKKNILSYLFQVVFVFLAFVSLFEAGLDSKTTKEQVKALITFIQGGRVTLDFSL